MVKIRVLTFRAYTHTHFTFTLAQQIAIHRWYADEYITVESTLAHCYRRKAIICVRYTHIHTSVSISSTTHTTQQYAYGHMISIYRNTMYASANDEVARLLKIKENRLISLHLPTMFYYRFN